MVNKHIKRCLISLIIQFSSVAQSCLTLCDPMDCSMPGSPALHHLPELAQIHVQGGRREEGSGWGTHVYLRRIHFDIWQNEYNFVKFKNKIKLKKEIYVYTHQDGYYKNGRNKHW